MSSSAILIPFDHQSTETVGGVKTSELWALTPQGEKPPVVGTVRTFYNTPATKITAISSLGEKFASKSPDAKRELLRKSVGSAIKQLKALDGLKGVAIDASVDPHAAAVAAHLALYKFSLKTKPPSPFNPNLKEPLPEKLNLSPIQASKEWERGSIYAKAQNLARTLMELPANIMTPTKFTERVKAEFVGLRNVEIIVRDEGDVHIHYNGAPSKDAQPLAFVGKGITFDSGGISLKPGAGMKLMRGDMGGAATVVSAALAVAQLQLPYVYFMYHAIRQLKRFGGFSVNLVVVTPLTENMPGPSATKPGDIVYAMNGKTVEIDNTDAEGRLILSDAIYYTSTEYKPHTLIDVATLTGAMHVALGEIFSGVFATSDALWEQLRVAGETEYDRFWRMPLDEDFGPQIHNSNADLQNTGGRDGGSCTAALFLKPFAHGIEAEDGQEPPLKWAHIDIAGSMEATRATPYQETGMTGRPVRALIEFVRNLSGAK
ncbi:hypothetical protein C0995_009222 [Termitomyces sp. Mi166|nr:hypothetical protein C0995_009222 [Termitomyces sp. Mi166\